MRTRTAIAAVGCVAFLHLLGIGPDDVASTVTAQGRKPAKPATTEIATVSKLPALGGNSEASAVNAAGTVIVGRSHDRAGLLYAVKWTLQGGSWAVTTLPYPTSAWARGVDDDGNAVGQSFPAHPVLWPAAAGFINLGCNPQGEAHAVSADGRVVVGPSSGARAWRADPVQDCGESLPLLGAGGSGFPRAVNRDGSIIAGVASPSSLAPGTPTIWIGPQGEWQVRQLDPRPGGVAGTNGQGDLAGYVTVPCAVAGGCQRAIIWYAAADFARRDLGTLGGDHASARDINSTGEVVGSSSPTRGDQTGFFWTASTGMLRLSANRRTTPHALSDARSDGTRVVVGVDDQGDAAVWVVRIP